MNKAKKALITVLKVYLAYMINLFTMVFISEEFDIDVENHILAFFIIGTVLFYFIIDFIFRKIRSRKASRPEKTAPEPVFEEKEPIYFEELKGLMCGQLVARYKETHDPKYSEEYERRLRSCGFSDPQATNMFMFELMILKHDHIAILSDPSYITRNYFNLKDPQFQESDEWYIEHQMFLLSEIVKIWDEAEYMWQNHKDHQADEKAMERIHQISRYGGGELFLGYIDMIAEKTNTPVDLVHAYAHHEQLMIWLYKWKQVSEHPYTPKR